MPPSGSPGRRVEAGGDQQQVRLEGPARIAGSTVASMAATYPVSPAPAWSWTFYVVALSSPGPPVPG